MTMPDIESRLKKLRQKIFSYMTAEEAKEYGFNLDPGWAVKTDFGGNGDEPRYTYVSPDKWEFSELAYDFDDELSDYIAISPEGERYTKAELEAGQAPTQEVTPLSERQYVTPAQFKILQQYKAQGTLGKQFLTTELWLTARQAKELGYNQGEADFQLSPLPRAEGEPEGRLAPPTIEPSEFEGLVGRLYPGSTIESLNADIQADQAAFLTGLQAKGRSDDSVALLTALGADETMIDEFFVGQPEVPQPQVSPFGQNLMKALPNIVRLPTATSKGTLDWAVQYFGNNPDKLRRELITAGRNADTEALVKSLYPEITDRGLKDYFSTGALAIEAEAKETVRRGTSRLFTAGVGDLVANVGGVFKWAGAEGIGDKLTEVGQFMQVQALPMEKGEFKWQDLFDPSSYSFQSTASGIIRAMPTLMTLAIPGIGAYGLAGSVAARLGLGALSRAIITGVGGSALSRPMESAMEAAGTYDESKERGLSHEEASRRAAQVFKRNLALVGVDIVQLTAAFAPTPFGRAGSIIGRGLVKTGQVGGKLAITGLTEGGEEIYQDILQRQARGERVKLDADSAQVFAIGALMGLGMGGGGDILMRVTDKVSAGFTPQQQATFDADVQANIAQGMDETQAKVEAMDKVVEDNPDVAESVQQAAKETDKELAQEALDRIQQPEAKVAPTPTTEAVVTAEKVTPQKIQQKIDDLRKPLKTVPRGQPAKKILDQISNLEGQLAQIKQTELFAGKTADDFEIKQTRPSPLGGKLWSVIDKTSGEEISASSSRALAQKSLDETLRRVKPAIPKAEAVPAQTWTEAGIQPSMLPEDVADIEIRPPAKGKLTQISMDDQLKLEQARQATEEAPEETQKAYQAQWEIEGLKAVHQVDPVANWSIEQIATRKTKQPDGSYKLTQYKRKVGLDSFIPIGQTEFPGTLTVKQARMINPNLDYSRWLQEGTREYNKVPIDVPLDPIASELGFTGTTAVNDLVARVNQIRKEKRQLQAAADTIKREMTERPLPAVPELTTEEVTEQWQMIGQPRYNLKQIDALVAPFAEYIMNPSTVSAYEFMRASLAMQRSERFNNLKAKLAEIKVQTGAVTEEQARQVITDTLSGEYAKSMTDYLQFITGELRDAHFAKVAHVLRDYPAEYAGTISALVNALDGRPIPNIRPTPPPGGFKSVLWPQGASALDKLQFVFGKGTQQIKALEKMAAEKKPLEDIVEGVFHETGRPPIPIDEASAEYLRNLPTIPFGQARLGEEPFILPSLPIDTRTAQQKRIDLENFKLELTPDVWKGWTPERLEEMSYLRINLLKTEYQTKLFESGWTPPPISDKRTAAQRALELDLFKIELAKPPAPPIPPTYFEKPIEDAFRQGQLWPRPVRDNVIRSLKELGMLPVDIGNFLRANKASVDFSFWRQQAPLIASHPTSFAQANVEAWRALWSQKSTEASWQRITRDPLYQIYEEVAAQGGDFLRPVILPKGTAQYRGTEEYGYTKGVERLLPRLTAALPWVKLSARAFETGTNVHNWLIFKGYYSAMLRYGEQIASGQKKLKAGEVFDIQKEMVDFSKSLTNFTARGSLGKFAATAPELSALFFAPRAAIGRILSVKDLLNANPRVRLEAWKNAASFVGTFGGIVLLGAAMGWWEVERDPRNAEYMSIRIGNTRIDPWGGYRQFLVFFARAITLTGVSSVTGAEYEVDPINLIQTFIRGKASPLASLILDFWRGKNFIGEEVDVSNKAQWAERVAPFAVWDIYEAYKDDPIHAIQAAIPAIVGAGVQTYTGDWKENFKKLGLLKYSENLSYGLTEPKYDTADFWSDHAGDFKGVDPATLTAKKGFPEYIRAIAEARVIKETLESLPSERFVSLNADPSKGATFADYYKMWRDRETIVASGDEEKLQAFDQDERTRNANLGNFSQRQFVLLNEYWSIMDKKKQAEFLKQHEAEIGVKPRDEYLRTHPKENAQLAVWGQAKILTKEAYNEFKSMVKELDIPDSALPERSLPPEGSIDNYFAYQDMENKNSWEAQLMMAKDDDLREFMGRQPIDTPIASLELKTEKTYHGVYNKLNDEDDPDWVGNQDDKIKDKDGLTAKDRAIADLKATKIGDMTYVDIDRKITAIEKGTYETPIPDEIVNAYVSHYQIVDQTSGNSAEAKLNRYDNPELNDFMMSEDYWGKQKATVLDEDKFYLDNYLVPRWRIEADEDYKAKDAEYEAIKNPLPAEQARLRAEWLAKPENLDYRKNKRRKEAYELNNTKTGERLPIEQVETYVAYYEIPNIKEGKRPERFVVENTDFAEAMYRITGKDIWLTKPEDVPNVAYDDIYDQYQDLFDEIRDNSDFQSEYYIKDKDEREARDEQIFAENPAFKEDYYRRQAYGLLFDEKYVDNYATFNVIPKKGYADERYLKAHQDFYFYAKKKLGWTSPDPKWDLIPSDELEVLINEYEALVTAFKKQEFRRAHEDLDEWLFLTGKVTKTIKEQKRRREMTPYERFQEDLEEIRKRLREI